MELLNRYLNAVRPLLPPDQCEDIAAELSENIRARVEDEESRLGRPLDQDEWEAILDQVGSPLDVARRYAKDGRNVSFGREIIGPELFPIYLRVLRINAWIALAVCLIVPVVRWMAGESLTPSGVVRAAIVQVAIQFGLVTLIFALVDRHLRANPDEWNPARAARRPPPRVPARVSRLESAARLIFLGILLSWWSALLAPERPAAPVEATESLRLGPLWRQLAWPVALLLLAGMAQAAVNLFRPEWTRFRAAARAATGTAWMLLMAYAIGAGGWVALDGPADAAPPKLLALVGAINRWCSWGAAMFALACLFEVILDIHHYYRGDKPARAASTLD